MAKMNPKVKAKWLAALRSGEYKQTQNKLTDHVGGFCCLGVLCNLYAVDRGIGNLYDLEGEHEELPCAEVLAWAGLDKSNRVSIDGYTTELYAHNDGGATFQPRTFAEIADAIEAQL